MKKCFVTKLAASVDNSELPKLGVLRFELLGGKTVSRSISSINGKSILSVVSGSLTMKNYDTEDPIDLPYTIVPSTAWKTITTGPEGATIEISNKYDLNVISVIFPLLYELDLNEFSLIPYLTSFVLSANSNTNVFGDISALSSCTNLTEIIFAAGNNYTVTGNIASWGPCISLNKVDIYNTDVTGDLVDLVNGQRTNGRTSGQINFGWLSTKTSFNGTPTDKRGSSILSWTENTITWDETTISM